MIEAAGELDCFSAHFRLREPGKSEDKAEGGTSVESSIPCSHGGRALVVNGAEEPSNLAISTTKRMGEVEYPSSLTYQAKELCISSSSTTQQQRQRVAGSQKGMLQPKQKIEDSAKCEEKQRL
ncbi:hypothetical protein BHM03_00058435 [Ensete ventricosum]|nr:hypothetical protein BHM03_00058435 [Ensete ventricosum]